MLYNACFIALILIVVFKSDAVMEYIKVFRLSRWFYVDDYELHREQDYELTYFRYLRQKHNCFFVRLVTCPICLSVWLSVIFSILWSSIGLFPVINIGALGIYYTIDKLSR